MMRHLFAFAFFALLNGPANAATCFEYSKALYSQLAGSSYSYPTNLSIAECVDSPTCISIQPNTGLPVVPVDGICRRRIVLDANDAAALDTITGASLLVSSMFAMPDPADVAAIWGFAFIIPIILYLASWAYGTLNGMFKTRADED